MQLVIRIMFDHIIVKISNYQFPMSNPLFLKNSLIFGENFLKISLPQSFRLLLVVIKCVATEVVQGGKTFCRSSETNYHVCQKSVIRKCILK